MIDTAIGMPITEKVTESYFKGLVNRFFKILPIRESGEETLPMYVQSLQMELLGCKEFVVALNDDSNLLTLLSILQYIHDNPDCPVADVKREVFRAINICNRLKKQYSKAV